MNHVLFFRLFIIYFLFLTTLWVEGAKQKVLLGVDILEQQQFSCLKGKKVGLLTHTAGVNGLGKSTIDVLYESSQVNLVALFGPEHGLRGKGKADQLVDNEVDVKTKLPIYSLYGKTRYPTADMLKKINVLVVDLQDVGVRSYTYVSCLCYAMEACFKAGIEVIVLDRPNPLGGLLVEGPPRDPEWKNYVGYLPVPYIHGLTIGELAQMALKEGWLDLTWAEQKETLNLKRLKIIPMKGWQRSMTWNQTGLSWMPTSPNIPTVAAVLGYAMTGLGAQLGGFGHGVGTAYPFRLLTFPNQSPENLKAVLEKKAIPGCAYEIRQSIKNKKPVTGVYIIVNNFEHLRPTRLSLYMMQLAAEWSNENPFSKANQAAADLFNKHMGSSAWWKALCRDGKAVNIPLFIKDWDTKAQFFKEKSKQYYLYY